MPLSAIQPESYEQLLADKIACHLPRFSALGAPPPEIYTSPTTGFRLRAEFRMWHDEDDLNYVMFKPSDRKTPVAIQHFPIVCDSIQQLMPKLLTALKAQPQLRRKLFQTEFLSTLSGETLISLIYHRPLDDDWQVHAEILSKELNVSIIGRSRKQKRVIGKDWVQESLEIKGIHYRYRQPEQAFTQPNGSVNQAMITWAASIATNLTGDLLELYCGIGNFTLPLAMYFDNVLATELSKVATAAAELNRQENNIANIEFARLSAEDMTSALNEERPFRRLAHLKQPLAAYQLQTLLVDPPRAGLDPATEALAARFQQVIYISCNPETLLANLVRLGKTHRITQLAFFDQFPYTQHLECGVLLERK